MTQPKLENAESRNLIIQVASSDEKRRSEAEHYLTEQGLNTVENLCAILNAEHRRRRKLRKPLEAVKWILYVLLSFLYFYYRGPRYGIALELFASCCVMFIANFCVSVFKFSMRNRFDRGMAFALSKFDDVRLVGPLLEVHFGGGKELVQPLLVRLLPRLQASDAPLLQEYHRNKLYTQLSFCDGIAANTVNTEFLLAILKALEQIGDEKAIKPVEKVAEKAKNQRIREAAKECLKFLKIREAEGKYQLLRASSASTTDLLHPIVETEAPQPNILPRPASSIEEN